MKDNEKVHGWKLPIRNTHCSRTVSQLCYNFMPDTPQRIATDTSQKMSIRFGETIKAYMDSSELEVGELIETYFKEMIDAKGAVRATLKKH